MKKFVGAAVGFLGGGIASLITVGLIVSIFELKYQSVLPGALLGASIGGLAGFFFPRLGEKLIEFIGYPSPGLLLDSTTPLTHNKFMVSIETPIFTKQLLSTLSDEEYRLFQATLLKRPDAGKVIPGSGGLRKVRWGLEGRGKSGGARVIYY